MSWEERLARAYESKLFKEFALVGACLIISRMALTNYQIDLKHYKSRRLALRWRTAEEVVEGVGEDTCASLRCKYHQPPSAAQVDFDDSERRRPRARQPPPLRAFELPFVYQEAGERKEALVKVKLCRRCEAKLTWKPGKEEVGNESDEGEDERAADSKRRRRSREGDGRSEVGRDRNRERTARHTPDDRRAERTQRSHSRDRHRSRSPTASWGRRLV